MKVFNGSYCISIIGPTGGLSWKYAHVWSAHVSEGGCVSLYYGNRLHKLIKVTVRTKLDCDPLNTDTKKFAFRRLR